MGDGLDIDNNLLRAGAFEDEAPTLPRCQRGKERQAAGGGIANSK